MLIDGSKLAFGDTNGANQNIDQLVEAAVQQLEA